MLLAFYFKGRPSKFREEKMRAIVFILGLAYLETLQKHWNMNSDLSSNVNILAWFFVFFIVLDIIEVLRRSR